MRFRGARIAVVNGSIGVMADWLERQQMADCSLSPLWLFKLMAVLGVAPKPSLRRYLGRHHHRRRSEYNLSVALPIVSPRHCMRYAENLPRT